MLRHSFALPFFAALAVAQPAVIKTGTLIDAKGGVLKNRENVIDAGL